MCAYPNKTTVPKGAWAQLKAGVSRFFRWDQQTEDGKEDFKPPHKANLATQCLHFYLEPYRNEILQEEKLLEVDSLAAKIAHIFSMIRRPRINHSDVNITELDMIVSYTYICTC